MNTDRYAEASAGTVNIQFCGLDLVSANLTDKARKLPLSHSTGMLIGSERWTVNMERPKPTMC